MHYIKKNLYIENIPIEKIAKKIGTPTYCYSLDKLKLNINNFKKNFKSINPLICFSVKSNSNIYILREIKKMKLGADVVSKGELLKVLKAGIRPIPNQMPFRHCQSPDHAPPLENGEESQSDPLDRRIDRFQIEAEVQT